MKKINLILAIIIYVTLNFSAKSQSELINSGPMVGYSEMKEVMIWVQTKNRAEVKIIYTNTQNITDKHITNTVITEKDKAFTAHLIADTLKPGQTYDYELYVNNKKLVRNYKMQFKTLPIWEWRTDPPNFSFATGSGAYINETDCDRPGKPYGGDYQIFESIAEKQPDFMIWLGDNVYLREPDWNSATGIIHRYTHDRAVPEMQKLLAVTHHYAIWDDHDFGPNDSDGSFWNKNRTLEAFKLFWANPSYGIGNFGGITSFFNWGDCDFFLLDNRYFRTPNNCNSCKNKTQLGNEQLNWLKQALTYSKANFKFIVIGGQFLNTSGFYETYSNYGFAEERAEIIEFIQNENIKNVIFLTGDRHHSEISVLKRYGSPTIYDITISPFTSGVATLNPEEVNSLRVEGSLINKKNFAVLNVSGKYKERVLKITFFDTFGKIIYEYAINAEK